MDFLKDILGTELFEQVANAVNAYNGDKQEMYLDAYRKEKNVCIKMEE